MAELEKDIKDAGVVSDDHHLKDGSEAPTMTVDWTPAEERRARWKIDMTLMPLMIMGFFALQIDRANIASALTSTITEDLGITTNEINVGNQLLSLGIFLLEIPSNMILMRVGPRLWLSCQIVAWSLVATFQAFMSNYATYLATRFLLGCMEAGFIPGCLYLLGSWYKRDEIRVRVTTFYLGQNFATATSSLLGAALLKLDGHLGWEGWRWLFALDGVITVFIGLVFAAFIPPAVGNGRPLISFGRWSYFTERECEIMKNRVIIDDPAKINESEARLTLRDIWAFMKKPKKWFHVFISISAVCAVHSLITYSPRMLKFSGFDTTRANALYSVSAYGAMVFNFILASLADHYGHSGPFIAFAVSWNVIAYACLLNLEDYGMWGRYAALILAGVPYSAVHALNVGWMASTYTSIQDRSVSSAFIIMSSNIAGVPSGQIFRHDDAPLYHRGMSILTGLAAFCWLLITVLAVWNRLDRRKKAKASSAV